MYYDSQGVFWYGTIRCIINSGWSQCDVTNWFVRFEGSSLARRHLGVLRPKVTPLGCEGGLWGDTHCYASILIGLFSD